MKHWFLLPVAVMLMQAGGAQTLIYTEGFETNGEGSRYVSNTFSDCVNSDYFFRTNTNPVAPPACAPTFGSTLTNLQGSFFWASEDIRTSSPVPNSRPPGSITTQAINVSGFAGLSVSLYLATSNNNSLRWEAADSINIQASFDGINYITVGRFMGKGTPLVGARLGIDGNLDGVYNGTDPATDCDVSVFSPYSFSIPGSGSTLYIRLDFDQVGGTEELAIDQIEVRGTSTLPVKLHYFNGRNIGVMDLLSWKTEDLSEAELFILERSADGILFEPFRTIVPHGSSYYETKEQVWINEDRFYRLRIREHGGREMLSPILRISRTIDQWGLKVVYPAQISIKAAMETTVHLRIYSIDGQIKTSWNLRLLKGHTLIPLPLLTAGNYLITLTGQNGQELGKSRFISSSY